MKERACEIIQNPLRHAVLGLIIGTVGLINFLVYGKSTLALGSYIPWGLWVSLYTFFLDNSQGFSGHDSDLCLQDQDLFRHRSLVGFHRGGDHYR